MYYRVEPDIYSELGITTEPDLPLETSFLSGRMISSALPNPLIFHVDYPPDVSPRHLLCITILVASHKFVAALRGGGAENFQTFPARLRNPDTGQEWTDYTALNVIGLVDALDRESSDVSVIMSGDDAGLPELVDGRDLVFTESKTGAFHMFRLLQDPTQLFIADHVKEFLVSQKPEGGWGITLSEIPTR